MRLGAARGRHRREMQMHGRKFAQPFAGSWVDYLYWDAELDA